MTNSSAETATRPARCAQLGTKRYAQCCRLAKSEALQHHTRQARRKGSSPAVVGFFFWAGSQRPVSLVQRCLPPRVIRLVEAPASRRRAAAQERSGLPSLLRIGRPGLRFARSSAGRSLRLPLRPWNGLPSMSVSVGPSQTPATAAAATLLILDRTLTGREAGIGN